MAPGPKDKHTPQPITAEETDLNLASTRALDPKERSRVYREAVPPNTPGPIPYDAVADEDTMVDPETEEWHEVTVGTGTARMQLTTRGATKVMVDGKRIPAGRVHVKGLNPNGTHALLVRSSDGRVRALEVKMKGRDVVVVDLD